jgi:signal transduction histidine kinase
MPRILVIDDEATLREAIVDQLQFEGMDVIVAADGREGVEQALRNIPDAIICDISMPELDGYEVLQILRGYPQTATIPFIFLTARAAHKYQRQGMELGADDYLVKPFTKNELLAAVRARLDRHETYYRDLENARKALMHAIKHELRTPLTGIVVANDLIEQNLNNMDPQYLQNLSQIIRSGSQRLQHVVEQIVWKLQIDSSALTAGLIAEKGYPLFLNDLIRISVTTARKYALHNKDLPIEFDDNDFLVSIFCMRDALKVAFSEIIINALSFSNPNGTVRIKGSHDNKIVTVVVADEGRGMPQPMINNAFEPFTQINREKYEQQGVGLGLWLARSIVALHNGQIVIESIEGKGTSVSISLPVSEG